MQQGNYTSAPYYEFQNPNPIPSNNPYASAPPFTPNYAPSDYNTYPSYPQNPDPTTPSSFPPSFSNPNLPPPFNPPFESNPSYRQPPYDQHQTTPIYASPNPNSTPSLQNSASPYCYTGASSVPPIPTYEPAYVLPLRSDHGGGGYFDDRYEDGFGRSCSDYYEKSGGPSRYDGGADECYGDGVYAYEGGKVEPYGGHGTALKSSTCAAFDDYGRPISFPSQKESSVGGKIVKAVPKAETQEDVKGGGVQKFRVKLLAESGGQSTIDVLCQIGLDGIRMLDPNTSRTLRIYPLENITRCDRFDSSTFAFWSKNPVDIELRRIRLQSNSYTTNTLLDTVTAATIQFKEMGGSRRPAESVKTNEQPMERKIGFGDWMNLIKPANEEKDHWVPDEAVSKCTGCDTDFGAFVRRHHCRNCGDIFCDKCTHGRIALTADENAQPVRVCDGCMAEVTQRLTSAKESSNKPVLQSHEDLARKLKEELERNGKTSGSMFDGSARRMKEVACPICTVHLQVQVPSSGSETIECGVCQHPFLVSAH